MSGKVKIFVLGKDRVGWSIDKDREAVITFLKVNDFEITKNILKATHIFCVWYDLLLSFRYLWIKIFKKFLHFKIIAVVTNDITIGSQKIDQKYIDVFIAPSNKIYNFLNNKGLKAYRVPFFIDRKVFKPSELSKQEICQKLKINYKKIENKVIIGSFQRDSLKRNLLKPKWQKNPDLLINILKQLPREEFILLLAGPRRHYIIKQCLKEKINFLFYGDYSYIKSIRDDVLFNNLPLKTINYLYGLSDIYIVTSKSEGGPKAIIEASLTKTLIFSTYVGLAPDILHPDVLFKDNNVNYVGREIRRFFKKPEEFKEYIEFNFKKARQKMDFNILKRNYRRVILENLK